MPNGPVVMTTDTTFPAPRLIATEGLGDLYRALVAEGYRVIGPTVQDGAIVLRELRSAAELPFGWGVRLEPGGYRLRRRDDQAAFGHSAGPQSWKQFLHPARERLWSVERTPDGGFEFSGEADEGEPPPVRLPRRPALRPAGDRDPGPGASAAGLAVRGAPRPAVHRRGELHRARRDLFLRLDADRARRRRRL